MSGSSPSETRASSKNTIDMLAGGAKAMNDNLGDSDTIKVAPLISPETPQTPKGDLARPDDAESSASNDDLADLMAPDMSKVKQPDHTPVSKAPLRDQEESSEEDDLQKPQSAGEVRSSNPAPADSPRASDEVKMNAQAQIDKMKAEIERLTQLIRVQDETSQKHDSQHNEERLKKRKLKEHNEEAELAHWKSFLADAHKRVKISQEKLERSHERLEEAKKETEMEQKRQARLKQFPKGFLSND